MPPSVYLSILFENAIKARWNLSRKKKSSDSIDHFGNFITESLLDKVGIGVVSKAKIVRKAELTRSQ